MSDAPVLSNPSIGGDTHTPSMPTSFSVTVDDPHRAAGLGDYITVAILRVWEKIGGSYRYIGAKTATFSAVGGTGSQVASVNPSGMSLPADAGEFAWTMEVRDNIGGIDGTAIYGRDEETLSPDGTTNFFVDDAGYVTMSFPSRMMYRWPKGPISITYQHTRALNSLIYFARLLKKGESGEYGVVSTTEGIVRTDVPGATFSMTWQDFEFPALDWNSEYAIEWDVYDSSTFSSGYGSRVYFSTDRTPRRPTSLSPGEGVAVTGYPLVTFFAEDADDNAAAPIGDIWPFNYVAKVGLLGTGSGQFNMPMGIAEDSQGRIVTIDRYSVSPALQMFDANLGFIQRLAVSGSWYTSIAAASSPNGATYEVFTGENTNTRVNKYTRTSGGNYALATTLAMGIGVWDVAVYNNKVYILTQAAITETNLSLASPVVHAMKQRVPLQMAINEERGWLYMLQSTPPQITVFDLTTWEDLFSFGSFGSGGDQLLSVESMASNNLQIDQTTGNVYWSDYLNYVVQVYDMYGNLLDWYVVPIGSGNGQFTDLSSIMISRSGEYMYTVDSALSRVQKLSMMSNSDLAALSKLNAEVEVNYEVDGEASFDTTIQGANSPVVATWTKALTWDGTVGADDLGSAKLTITVAPTSIVSQIYINPFAAPFPVVPGEEYSFTIAVRTSTPLLEFVNQLRWLDPSMTLLSTAPNDPSVRYLGVWRLAYSTTRFFVWNVRGIAPPKAAYAEPQLRFRRTTTAAFSGPQYVWIDDAIFSGDGRFMREATSLGGGSFSWQPTSTEMPDNRVYKIRARAKDAVQVGPWSDLEVIQKVTGPTVVIDAPTPGQVFSSVSPLILWQVTAGSQWAFKVEIYHADTTLDIAYDSGWVQSESARSFVVPPGYLEDGVNYYMRLWIDDGTLKVLV